MTPEQRKQIDAAALPESVAEKAYNYLICSGDEPRPKWLQISEGLREGWVTEIGTILRIGERLGRIKALEEARLVADDCQTIPEFLNDLDKEIRKAAGSANP